MGFYFILKNIFYCFSTESVHVLGKVTKQEFDTFIKEVDDKLSGNKVDMSPQEENNALKQLENSLPPNNDDDMLTALDEVHSPLSTHACEEAQVIQHVDDNAENNGKITGKNTVMFTSPLEKQQKFLFTTEKSIIFGEETTFEFRTPGSPLPNSARRKNYTPGSASRSGRCRVYKNSSVLKGLSPEDA